LSVCSIQRDAQTNMLTLTRRKGERLNIGLSVEITVLEVSGGRVRLGITAPRRLAVHRGEIVERMEQENRTALAIPSDTARVEGATLDFPDGLIGMPEHTALLLCDSTDDSGLHILVSKSDPCIQLPVAEALRVMANYPEREARAAADFEHEETAVALVVTMPKEGNIATVNLQAPVVIGLQSRRGKQVILLRDDLPMRHPLLLPLPPTESIITLETP
jgi:carbon storage regulator